MRSRLLMHQLVELETKSAIVREPGPTRVIRLSSAAPAATA
ncbi:hypothetical protein ACFQ3Z_00170 [Streptomyces nogalater]